MICENCKKQINLKYGSGRFCSEPCARSFSTSTNKNETNKKISNALMGKGNAHVNLKCKFCNIDFEVSYKKRNQKFCSRSCIAKFNNSNDNYLDKLRKSRISYIKDGKYNGYGIRSNYLFNGKEIRCDSNVENACLNYFDDNGATEIDRCNFEIPYDFNGKKSIFIPDFKIILGDKILIVEAKSYISINSVNEKWKEYNQKSIIKKMALEEFCKMNNFESFWFTKDMNLDYYRSLIARK